MKRTQRDPETAGTALYVLINHLPLQYDPNLSLLALTYLDTKSPGNIVYGSVMLKEVSKISATQI